MILNVISDIIIATISIYLIAGIGAYLSSTNRLDVN
jgi:hypothetical protein